MTALGSRVRSRYGTLGVQTSSSTMTGSRKVEHVKMGDKSHRNEDNADGDKRSRHRRYTARPYEKFNEYVHRDKSG